MNLFNSSISLAINLTLLFSQFFSSKHFVSFFVCFKCCFHYLDSFLISAAELCCLFLYLFSTKITGYHFALDNFINLFVFFLVFLILLISVSISLRKSSISNI